MRFVKPIEGADMRCKILGDGLDLKIDGGTFSELSTKGGIIVHHVFLGSGSKEFPYEQGSTKNELKENTSRVEAL